MAEIDPGFRRDGGSTLSRREFVKGIGMAALTASTPLLHPHWALAALNGTIPSAHGETAVARFYKVLKDDQCQAICFPFDHPMRSQVHNNWAVVMPTILDLSSEQRSLCREIFKNLCSDEGYGRFIKQMDDDYGGFESYHVALFGEPGTGQPFEWLLTGRHATLRVDGNSPQGAASGGPILYGHADPNRESNVWSYQGEQAGKLFKTLDARQRARALVTGADRPRGVTGLDVSELDGEQKRMVQQLLRDLTSPFRTFDVKAVRECLDESRGVDKLRLSYFQECNAGVDEAQVIWKLEGPAFAWYYHGSPHVHVWINVAPRV